MTDKIKSNSEFYECSLQLFHWSKGTDLLKEIIEQVESQIATLHKLYEWKCEFLLFPKPTLSTFHTFVFWVHSSIVDNALCLTGVRGGFNICQNDPKRVDSSSYKGKKHSCSRRVLLDIGCDDPTLIKALTQLGFEVELVWRHTADMLNYEIIEICTTQNIDVLVSTNEQILTPPEEWLTYLMPHRTRLYLPPSQLLKDPKALAQAIYDRAFFIRKRKRAISDQLQNEYFRTLERKFLEKIK